MLLRQIAAGTPAGVYYPDDTDSCRGGTDTDGTLRRNCRPAGRRRIVGHLQNAVAAPLLCILDRYRPYRYADSPAAGNEQP